VQSEWLKTPKQKVLKSYQGQYSKTAAYAAHIPTTHRTPRNTLLPSPKCREPNFSVSSSKMTGNDILSTTSHSAKSSGVIWNTTCISHKQIIVLYFLFTFKAQFTALHMQRKVSASNERSKTRLVRETERSNLTQAISHDKFKPCQHHQHHRFRWPLLAYVAFLA